MKKKELLWLYQYVKKYLLWIFLLSLLSMFMVASFFGITLEASSLLDAIINSNKKDIQFLIYSIGFLFLLQLFVSILNNRIRVYVINQLEIIIQTELFKSVLNKKMQQLELYHSGDFIHRLTSDVEVIAKGVTTLFPNAISMLTRLSVGLCILVFLDVRFTTLIVFAGVCLMILHLIFQKKFKNMHKNVQQAGGEIRSFFQECFDNILLIKSFVNENIMLKKLFVFQNVNAEAKRSKSIWTNAANVGIYFTFTLGYYLAMILGGIKIANGILTFGGLTAFLQVMNQLRTPFQNLASLLPQYYEIIASVERLMQLERLENETYKECNQDFITHDFSFDALCGKNVCFSYDGETEVLHNANFCFKQGKISAVFGVSAAGKSTLLKLLLSIELPQSGDIYIIRKDKQILPVHVGMRHLFSYVPQRQLMFSATIRENLVFNADEKSDEEIKIACEVACIWDEICQEKDGLDTHLKEKGAGFSQGQLQRLTIARSLLSDAPILLFDECTSALDCKTEQNILENIKRLKNKTVIFISHRKAILDYCDEIYVVQEKKIYRKEM